MPHFYFVGLFVVKQREAKIYQFVIAIRFHLYYREIKLIKIELLHGDFFLWKTHTHTHTCWE